ncbi:MAG: response regulator transcription factor [Nitrospirae bacterium]|nr:response regulator transcription factor [Nitrospirota bacterium]
MKVLLIEDDKILRESLKAYLESKGISAECLLDEMEYESCLSINTYDAMILDLMLRFVRGEDILKRIRARGLTTPVLVLTAKNSINDKETCFSLGADDYLTKPFDIRELLIRLRALSNKVHVQRVVKIGGATVDLDGEVLYVNGREVSLSKRAWSLLSYLVKHRGQVVSPDTIIGYVWGDKAIGDEAVRTYVKILRKVLPKDVLTTYKGRGYKLD